MSSATKEEAQSTKSAKTKKLNNSPETETIFKKHRKAITKNYTLCIPSTVISFGNSKSLSQSTFIAYQIAKNSTIYNVSEIVILDIPDVAESEENKESIAKGGIKDGKKIRFDSSPDVTNQLIEKQGTTRSLQKKNIGEESMILATLLQYFITPPYLVNSIFKDKKYLKYVKNYPTLTTLPFLQTNFFDGPLRSNFREGLSIPEKSSSPEVKHVPGSKVKKAKKRRDRLQMTSYINCGLAEPVKLQKDEKIPVNVRVTVDTKNRKIVSPLDAYYANTIGANVSVGYHVRVAKLFSSIFTESAFPEGYTAAVFMESGNYFNNKSQVENSKQRKTSPKLENINQLDGKNEQMKLLVFTGKERDFEKSFKADDSLKEVENICEFFNYQLDLKLPFIRTEDAILLALTKIEAI